LLFLVVEVVVKELVLVVAVVDLDKFNLTLVELLQSLLELVELVQDLLEVKELKEHLQYFQQ
tara:strand:+ start:176 stop:361 length:186 start_codon:yes stop_codon:yes gene_type:complete